MTVDNRDIGRRHRQWLLSVLKQTGLKPSRLAKDAGLAMTTLTRPAKDDTWDRPLAAGTIEKIVALTGIPAPGQIMQAPIGLREAEPEMLDPAEEPDPGTLDAIVTAVIGGRDMTSPYILHSDALELEGHRPGDIMIIDHDRPAQAHDVVLAQMFGEDGMPTRLLFRIFEPPYLIAMTRNVALRKPILVDAAHCEIIGVLDTHLRPAWPRHGDDIAAA